MSKVVQFFSEFSNLRAKDIARLDSLVKQEDLMNITNSDIKDILPQFDMNSIDIAKSQETLKKIDEINDKNNIDYITFLDEKYPNILRESKNYPKILYYKGDVDLLNYDKNIGVVGSRKPTSYGKWVTSSIVKQLVENEFCIVSGFAYGVDSISHKSALENGGKTICVFATPVNKIYPTINKKLYDEVLEKNNLIISENHVLKNPIPRMFALRNRIISGVSSSLLITEAGEKSGTLITANYAMEQGKTIFAVVGNINSANSMGTNNLVKEGACMVTSVDDILFEYGYDKSETMSKMDIDVDVQDMSASEKTVYKTVLENGQCHSEKISLTSGLSIQEVISVLNILDIKGYISYDGFIASTTLK